MVMLYTGNREWSRWVIHGSKDDVCSRSCCPPCSKGWTHFGKSCYFYSKTVSSWEKAQHFCSVLGMQLLEVDSPEEKVKGGRIQASRKGDGEGGHCGT
nr:PREDICTED: C-type lectin domain family 4 member C-like [Haliaeetus albicilla]